MVIALKSVAEHLRDCRSLLCSRPPVIVPTLHATGLRLAEPVRAAAPYPAFVASAMDGYAVRSCDLPGRLAVVGDVPAGSVPQGAVAPGTAIRVMTGAPVPAGADAVVPIEDVRVDGRMIEIAVAIESGRHIRGVGDDVRAGDLVVGVGRTLGASQVAALAAHNVVEVAVHPPPRVAVISTGEELVPFGSPPGNAQLVDSNGPGLAAAARAAGADVVSVSHVGDDVDRLLAALGELPEVELVVTSGGVSVGAYDVVKAALASQGIVFEAVAMQPGKPQAWGTLALGCAFLGLPGNPVAALVSFELFGRAALGRERTSTLARLVEPVVRSPKGKRQYLRGVVADGEVRPLNGSQSHLVAGLANANCLAVIGEDVESMPAGAVVPVMLLGTE
jgi:molybdopterin molybdotransferase